MGSSKVSTDGKRWNHGRGGMMETGKLIERVETLGRSGWCTGEKCWEGESSDGKGRECGEGELMGRGRNVGKRRNDGKGIECWEKSLMGIEEMLGSAEIMGVG
jgi:hypothetical protein